MTTTRDMLNTLNTRRVANGQKPLKAWKDSKAKLQAAIDALPAVETPKKTKKKAMGNDTITLAEIARELGMNPKVARAKARRRIGTVDSPAEIEVSKYTYKRTDKDAVIAYLTLDHRTRESNGES